MADSNFTRLIVKNLPEKVDSAQVHAFFSVLGDVTDARVMRKPDGKSRCFGFVGFRTHQDASNVLKGYNKTYMQNKILDISVASPRGTNDDENCLPKKRKKVAERENETQLIPPRNEKSCVDPSQKLEVENHHVSDMDSLFDIDAENQKRDNKFPRNPPDQRDENEIGNTLSAESEECSDSSDRIFVSNIPYTCTEEELKSYFESFGRVEEVKVLREKDTQKSRGLAFVKFLFPEHAAAAIIADDQLFQGRIIRIQPAREAITFNETYSEALHGSQNNTADIRSWKKMKLQKLRAAAPKQLHTWNLLYMSTTSIVTAASDVLAVDQNRILDVDVPGGEMALRVAVGETEIISRTKQWLKEQGVNGSCFERTGTGIMSATHNQRRSDDTIIIKHLPPGIMEFEIQDFIMRFMDSESLLWMQRLAMPPSRTLALVQFVNKEIAARCFRKIAFRMFKGIPLYLEWAPENVWIQSTEIRDETEVEVDDSPVTLNDTSSETKGVSNDNPQSIVESNPTELKGITEASIFVKNIPFSATPEELNVLFKDQKGFIRAVISTKKSSEGRKLPMGFGFLYFDSIDSATRTIKEKHNVVLSKHTLQLQLSRKEAVVTVPTTEQPVSETINIGTRLVVKNVPFQATKSEIRKLFSVYGTVSSVRLPKKVGGVGHRGFGFVEFSGTEGAISAYEALQTTHLYGRKLVIQSAEILPE